jgi:uncharacterized protein YpmS
MKQLQTVLDRNTTTSIFYVLGNLSEPTVKGIKSYVESLTNKEIEYNIYHSPDINVNGSAKLFKNVVEFE